jgi:hypothetical protein
MLISERMERMNITVAHQWVLKDRRVYLVKRGEDPEYIVTDLAMRILQKGPIPNDCGLSADHIIECLIDTEPFVQIDEKPTFKENHSIAYQWDLKDKNIALLREGDNISWQLIDRIAKITSRIDFTNTTISIPSEEYFWDHLYTDDYELINGQKQISSMLSSKKGSIRLVTVKFHTTEKRIEFATNCHIHNIVTAKDGCLHELSIAPIYSPVFFNPQKSIDSFTWAITLVSGGTDWHGHAVLFVETFEDQQHLIYKTHFAVDGKKPITTVPGKVTFDLKEREDLLPYLSNDLRKSWLVERKNVQFMIADIKEEIARQENGEDVSVFFNSLGSNALLVPEKIRTDKGERDVDNCLTWALNKLSRVGIHLNVGSSGAVMSAPKQFLESYKENPDRHEYDLRLRLKLYLYEKGFKDLSYWL